MNDILDEDIDNPQPDLGSKDRVTFVYSLIMLVGGVAVFKYLTPILFDKGLLNLLKEAFTFEIICIGLGVIIKLIRRLFKSTDEVLFSRHFWLDAIEEGFSIWCLLVIFYALRVFFLVY